MKIAFTLCSNNYLAQAKTLGDSLIKHNPDYKFIIGLIDSLSPEINYSSGIGHEILPLENIGIPNLEELWKRYNIIELNTCIKPSYYKHLFSKYPDSEFIIFFDPDIMIFNKLSEVETELEENDFVLIPHIYKPIPVTDKRPNDHDFLNYGIYNLGFLGLKNSKQIHNVFMPWWEERTIKLGYIRTSDGLFVDQLWFNLVPLFFNKISILTHTGYDVAPWNLQERTLSLLDDEIIINNNQKLVFYHFSSYRFNNPGVFFYNYDRNLGRNVEVLNHLYSKYHHLLIENNIEKYSKIKCHYSALKEQYEFNLKKETKTFISFFKRLIINILPYFIVKILKHRFYNKR